jgi:putative ABC transport system permease protein
MAQLLGVEFDTGIELDLDTGDADLDSLLRPDGHVMVAQKNRQRMGVHDAPGDRGEILGRTATVVGFVEDIHVFTLAGFILTDLDNARAFMKLPPSHATYIVCKCRAAEDVPIVVRQLRRDIPEHDVLTTREFHDMASTYWEEKSGIGPVLLLPAVLGGTVGFLMVMLTFYISTIQKIPAYACMKALGGSTIEIIAMLIVELLVVFVIGSAIAGLGLFPVLAALRSTTISVVITRRLVFVALGTLLACSALGSLLSVARIARIEPGKAFRS